MGCISICNEDCNPHRLKAASMIFRSGHISYKSRHNTPILLYMSDKVRHISKLYLIAARTRSASNQGDGKRKNKREKGRTSLRGKVQAETTKVLWKIRWTEKKANAQKVFIWFSAYALQAHLQSRTRPNRQPKLCKRACSPTCRLWLWCSLSCRITVLFLFTLGNFIFQFLVGVVQQFILNLHDV